MKIIDSLSSLLVVSFLGFYGLKAILFSQKLPEPQFQGVILLMFSLLFMSHYLEDK